jgi:hypothetical protein
VIESGSPDRDIIEHNQNVDRLWTLLGDAWRDGWDQGRQKLHYTDGWKFTLSSEWRKQKGLE